MNFSFQKIFFSLLILSFSTTLFSYNVTYKKYDLINANRVPITSKTQNVSMTVKDETIKFAQGKSSFDCDTGKIDVNVEILEDLNSMFKSFGTNAEEATKQFVKEMATQAGIDATLEILARLHYQYTQDVESGGVFTALQMTAVTSCVTNGVFNAFESEIEIGVGVSIFDMLAGKVGINFVDLAGIYPCIKEALGTPKTKEAKEQLEKSRQWVRYLFYKMLNNSFDTMFNMQLGVGKIDPKCKELRKQARENPVANLAQFGKVLNPDGTYTETKIKIGEPTAVGLKVDEGDKAPDKKIKDDDEKVKNGQKTEQQIKDEETDATLEAIKTTIENDSSLTEEEARKQISEKEKSSFLKKASSPFDMEVPSSFSVLHQEPLDVIDLTDLSNEQIILFNKNIYKKVKYLLDNEKTIYNDTIKEQFLYLLKKVLTLTKKDNYNIYQRDKLFSEQEYDNSADKIKILSTKYYNKLFQKSSYANSQVTGILGNISLNEHGTLVVQTIPNSTEKVKEICELKDIKKIQKRISDFDFDQYIIASGEPLFFDTSGNPIYASNENEIFSMILNLYEKDYSNFSNTPYSAFDPSVTKVINEHIVTRKPLHELEYLRTLYQMESRSFIIMLLGANPGQQIQNFFVSKRLSKITNSDKSLIDYSIKKMKIVKEIYAVELLDLYAKRSEFINNWVMDKFQQNYIITNDTTLNMDYQINKFKLKLLEKRILIKLMLEKEVE